jgi:hypothetical protein
MHRALIVQITMDCVQRHGAEVNWLLWKQCFHGNFNHICSLLLEMKKRELKNEFVRKQIQNFDF